MDRHHGAIEADDLICCNPRPGFTATYFGRPREIRMKIVVIGGTGLIGSKLATVLRQRGQEVLAPSPESGSKRSPRKDWPQRSLAPEHVPAPRDDR